MGCVVNGPGESKHADIGISLPGTFEAPVAPVFIDGKLDRTLRGEGLVDEFVALLEDYVAQRYASPAEAREAPVSQGSRSRASHGRIGHRTDEHQPTSPVRLPLRAPHDRDGDEPAESRGEGLPERDPPLRVYTSRN